MNKRILLSAPKVSGFEMRYIEEALRDDWIVPMGPHVDLFENRIKDYLGADIYPVAMTSGTSAIHIALILLGVKPHDEIFCSSLTFSASANPIVYLGAKPVFIDTHEGDVNLDPKALEKAILYKKAKGKVPKALIVADLYGIPANYEEILSICNRYNIALIEDSAEALGSRYKNIRCGLFGNYGILSFNGNKIISTSGGGMLLCHTKEEADRAKFLITQAKDPAPYYLHSEIGYNYRLSNISAAIGLGQMDDLENRILRRREIHAIYKKNLKNMFVIDEGKFQFSNYWLNVGISTSDPVIVMNSLKERNIEARLLWKPLHTQPVFKNCEFFTTHKNQSFSEELFSKSLCLPSGHSLTDEDILFVCNEVNKF